MTWISLTWLSVAREYDAVLRAYIYGTLLAVAGMVFISLRGDTVGVLGAYTVGQAFTLVHLIRVIVRGMEAGGKREFKVLTSLVVFPRLMVLGVVYNSAIWVDKMIFWFWDGIGRAPLCSSYHPLYDTCSFLAYLTVMPGAGDQSRTFGNLVLRVRYRAYYGAILGETSARRIIEEKRKSDARGPAARATIRLLRVQGFITIIAIIFAPQIIQILELPPVGIRIFRLTTLGAMFHVLLLLTLLMQLYFDLRNQALATTTVFFLLNGGLAWWSVDRGISSYGIGYAIASFLSLLLGFTLLHRSLERLDHLTFTNQSIAGDDAKPELEVPTELGVADPGEEATEPPEAEEKEREPEPVET